MFPLLGLAGDLSGQAFAQLPDPIPFTANDLAGLQTELEDLERNGELWGVVLIADGTDIVLHEAFGLADRNRDVANSTGTAFNIASIGKQLTATAVLQLAQCGRLDLNDPTGRWIDGLPGSTGETVTVRHLLRMEAGWGDYMDEAAYREDPKAFRTISDYGELIRTLEPDFAPGSDFAYSNVSYELLGAVIEAATGQSYADALQELVLDPAGMSATGCFVHEPAKGRAVPYTESDAGHLVTAYPLMAYRCSPAGGPTPRQKICCDSSWPPRAAIAG